jgi:biuret amidohydrolase
MGNKLQLLNNDCALIIVDMQVEGCERHGPGVLPVIGRIRSLLDRFRKANGNVIHIQSVRHKEHPEFTFFGRPYSLLIDSPGAEFVEELKPLPGELVVQKFSHDCFYQTRLEELLQQLGIRPCQSDVVVTGIGSNNCVYHAVIGFHIRNFKTLVPEDCIHATHPDGQAFALSQFRSHAYDFNINVVTSGDLEIVAGERMTQSASVGTA